MCLWWMVRWSELLHNIRMSSYRWVGVHVGRRKWVIVIQGSHSHYLFTIVACRVCVGLAGSYGRLVGGETTGRNVNHAMDRQDTHIHALPKMSSHLRRISGMQTMQYQLEPMFI